ncbi:MAG: acyl-CoA dehydrogenase family protein [Pseudomonadota bacterium]
MTQMAQATRPQATDWSAWAEDMSARVATRARQAETERRLPQATIDEAREAGFFDMLTPPALGGEGASFRTFLDTVRQLGQGCASSAWTLSFLSLHAWLFAKFGAEAQDELFRSGAPLAPAPLAPTGRAVPVDGGYRITGRWEWATGVNHSDWAMVSCLQDNNPVPLFCVLPLSRMTVVDVWHVAGMAATGSQMITCEDVVVPSHMALSALELRNGPCPGAALHPGTTVVYPFSATLALVAATSALGAAEGALAAFTERMRTKVQAYAGARQADLPLTHFRLGEGRAAVLAARAIWDRAIDLLERDGPAGEGTPLETLLELRLSSASVVRQANVAADLLAAAAGASSGFLSAPLQRHLRDLQMMRGHVVFDWDRAAQVVGRIALGGQPGPADLL